MLSEKRKCKLRLAKSTLLYKLSNRARRRWAGLLWAARPLFRRMGFIPESEYAALEKSSEEKRKLLLQQIEDYRKLLSERFPEVVQVRRDTLYEEPGSLAGLPII